MKFRPLFYFISLMLISISVFSILRWNFKKSIDFVGGTVWEISLADSKSQADIESVFAESQIALNSITSSGNNRFLIKFAHIDSNQKNSLSASLQKIDPDFKELRFETLGPSLGRELLEKTVYGLILASVCLLLFIGSRFKDYSFGAAAVMAMFHDSLILVGSFSLFGHFFGAELDALFVTALLTTLSSSVHDTVVTFDRIRELKRQNYRFDWVSLANKAVSEVIVRSINNSMTIIFMLLALVLLGGESTRWFATALLVGVVMGTYSSTAVAIPLVLFFKRKQK